MKKIFLLLILLPVSWSFLPAQQNNIHEKQKHAGNVKVRLSGKITDAKTGEALGGASVTLADIKLGVVADEQGRYVFNNVPDGHHLIEVSHTGYTTIVEHIDMLTDMEKDFSLQPSVVENQEVIVTGVSNATSIRKAAVPITTVKRAELLQTASTNIIDALSRKPGIAQITTGPGISKPVIRGLGYNRVVVMNDGARQEGQQWGDEHGIEIDEQSVAKAEILKGPSSLMYGSDAIAGVIHLISHVPVPESVIKGNVFAGYQTNNRQYSLNTNIAGNRNGFNWNVYGSHKSAGDYRNKYDGRVLNSRFNEKNFGGYAGLNKSWGYSHLIFSSFNQQLGLVEGDRDDATGKFILFAGSPVERVATGDDLASRSLFVPKQSVQHYKIVSDNNFSLGKSRLKLNLGYQNNLRKEFGNPEDVAEKELYFDLRTIHYNIQWVLPEMNEWHTTAGISGMRQWNTNKGEEVIIPEYRLLDVGAFVFAQRFFKKATLSGGFRFDNRSVDSEEFLEGPDVKFEAFRKSFSNFSGSIGISYEPADYLTLKANLARGFRSPNMAELASNGAHEGTNRYEYGEQDLESETSLQVDGGIDINYDHFTISLSAFYNHINDFIYYRKLEAVAGGDSLVNVDGEDIPAFRFDGNDARLYGWEASIDLHPHPLDWLHFENTFSFVRGKFDTPVDGTVNLPLIPAPRWTSELKANFSRPGKTFHNIYFRTELQKTFEQRKPFTAFNTETATDGYSLLNAGAGADISKKGKMLFSVHFAALNITDVAYQNHLSRLKYAAENMTTGRTGVFNGGRNYSFKINIPFQF